MPLCNTYLHFTNTWDINKHLIDSNDTYKCYYNSVDIFNFWPLTEVNCLYSTLALVNTRILWLTNISSNKNNLDQIYTTHSAQHFIDLSWPWCQCYSKCTLANLVQTQCMKRTPKHLKMQFPAQIKTLQNVEKILNTMHCFCGTQNFPGEDFNLTKKYFLHYLEFHWAIDLTGN